MCKPAGQASPDISPRYVFLSRSCSCYLMLLELSWYNYAMFSDSSPQTPGIGPHQVRPPCSEVQISDPGVSDLPSIRPTAVRRRSITPRIETGTSGGVVATHDYVRRYWIPVIGPGAVADLLRLTAAAQSGRSLPEPIHLPSLLRLGLAHRTQDTVFVPLTVRTLDHTLVRRLPPSLRRSHLHRLPA
jgi:hypothetical protein